MIRSIRLSAAILALVAACTARTPKNDSGLAAAKPPAKTSATSSPRAESSATVVPNTTEGIKSLRPTISSLTPSAADGSDARIVVVVQGTGFAREHNRVSFGSIDVGDLPSPDGRTITFTVPVVVPTAGDAPPPKVMAGKYPVVVTNGGGASNAIDFQLTSNRQ